MFSESIDPGPEVIRQECLRIQESWTEGERYRRGAWFLSAESVEIPVIESAALGLAPDWLDN